MKNLNRAALILFFFAWLCLSIDIRHYPTNKYTEFSTKVTEISCKMFNPKTLQLRKLWGELHMFTKLWSTIYLLLLFFEYNYVQWCESSICIHIPSLLDPHPLFIPPSRLSQRIWGLSFLCHSRFPLAIYLTHGSNYLLIFSNFQKFRFYCIYISTDNN